MTFAPEALDFLRNLERNNEREWFHARQAAVQDAPFFVGECKPALHQQLFALG